MKELRFKKNKVENCDEETEKKAKEVRNGSGKRERKSEDNKGDRMREKRKW